MKNTTFEAIRNGQKVATEDLFGLINVYNFTDLIIQDENNVAVVKVQVDKFTAYENDYEFSQLSSDSGVCVKESDIISIESEYPEGIDTLFIKCQMSDGKKLRLAIPHILTNFKSTEYDNNFYEIDLEDLQNLLENTLGDNAEYHCGFARFNNSNGMSIKITSPERTYIDTLDDSAWKLHVSDWSTVLEVPVTDDDYNTFYRKDDGDTVTIMVKPLGQPFAEIRMIFVKR